MLQKIGKKKIEPKKYVVVMIAVVLFLSALSVWCIIPNNTAKSSLIIRTYDPNVECFAQGDYTPNPLETTKITPTVDKNEPIMLCGAQGDYKPKPLKPHGG